MQLGRTADHIKAAFGNRTAIFDHVSSGRCGICISGQRRPISACASVHSDQDLCCPRTKALDIQKISVKSK